MDQQPQPIPFTFVFKQVEEASLSVDVYLPSNVSALTDKKLPAVVFFHGGGLCSGNRQSWFPTWLISTYIFISQKKEPMLVVRTGETTTVG